MRLSTLLLALVPLAAWGEAIVIDSDSRLLFTGLQQTAPARQAAGNLTVIQVINLQGNNPFHPSDPLLNWNGRRVASLTDLVALLRGGGLAVGGGQACVPTQATSVNACIGASVGLHFDLASGACAVSSSNLPGYFEGFWIANEPVPAGNVKGNANTPNSFALVNVPAGWNPALFGYAIPVGNHSVTLRHTPSGRTWQFNLTADGLGAAIAPCNYSAVRMTVPAVNPQ